MAVNDIIALRDKVRELPAFESKLDKLEAQIQALNAQISDLSDQHARARKDAKRLRGVSPQSVLLRLTGRFQDKIEEARQQEHKAKQVYDRAVTQLEDLSHYRDKLQREVDKLCEMDQKFITIIDEIRVQSGEFASVSATKHKQLTDEREAIDKRLNDIEEACKFAAGTEYMLNRSLDVAFIAYSKENGTARQVAEQVTSDETEYLLSRLNELLAMMRNIPGIELQACEHEIQHGSTFGGITLAKNAFSNAKTANEALLRQNRYAQEDLLIDNLGGTSNCPIQS